jgi:serine/threonine protein phosphatase PrpC
MDSDKCGATACVAVVRKELNNNVVYVGNLGDSRAVLNRNGKAHRLSKDHKATDPDEISRIKSQGGSIMEGRVAGGLAITRAFGDFTYKKYGVIASPYVVRHVLRP